MEETQSSEQSGTTEAISDEQETKTAPEQTETKEAEEVATA